MKIVCIQEDLSHCLQVVSRAIALKTTLPILTGIYLETSDNSLKCIATDLEIAIEVNVPNVQIFTPGALVLPGKTFVEIIKRLPPLPVEIEFDENAKMVSIISSHSAFQLPVLPKEEFPNFPEIPILKEKIEVNGEILKEAIRQTVYATLIEDPRPFLSSILWEISEERLRLVATDVNRLAIKDIPVKNGVSKSILVPVRSLREIANVFGNSEDNLSVYFSDKLIYIKGEGIRFSSRLIEAQFPRYEQVIPKEFNGTLIVNRNEFMDALERTSLVSNSIKILISNQIMVINAKEPDKGYSKEEVSIEFSGKEIEIGFNARFLIDFLRSIDSSEVIFKYIHELKPALMQGQGKEDYCYIVMPLKLSV